MRPSRTALTLVVLGLMTSVVRAEDAAAPAVPPAGPQAAAPAAANTPGLPSATYAAPSTAWQLHGALGFGAADGKYGDVLQKPLQWDIGIAKRSASGKWLFGVNLQFGSMDPADDPNIPPETAEAWLAPTWSGPASRRPSAPGASSTLARASGPTSRAASGSSASTRAASCSGSSPRPRTSSPATAPPRPPTASASRCSRASRCRSARPSRSTSPPSGPSTRPGRTTWTRSACRPSTPASSGARALASTGDRSRRRHSIRRARRSWWIPPRASRCRCRRPTATATPGACRAAGAGRPPRCS